ncbi:MAG: hypothetical protein MUF58_12940 [Arcicella sp.]|jgi:hypothetical protein|nr:hypothetical protein [Arcicella sp.]
MEQNKAHIESSLGCQMIGMEIVDFEIKSKQNIQKDKLGFGIELKYNISQDGNIEVDIKVIMNDGNIENLLCSVNILYHFFLSGYQEWLSINNHKSGELPIDLMHIMNGIAVSTSRGVLFTKQQGTFLEGVCLPIIDLASLHQQVN